METTNSIPSASAKTNESPIDWKKVFKILDCTMDLTNTDVLILSAFKPPEKVFGEAEPALKLSWKTRIRPMPMIIEEALGFERTTAKTK